MKDENWYKLLSNLLFQMGYFRKSLPSPDRGGWNPRLFLVKYSPGFPVLLDKNTLFSHGFLGKTPLRRPKSKYFRFLTLDFQKINVKLQVEFQTFCIRSNDILYGGRALFIWNSPIKVSILMQVKKVI